MLERLHEIRHRLGKDRERLLRFKEAFFDISVPSQQGIKNRKEVNRVLTNILSGLMVSEEDADILRHGDITPAYAVAVAAFERCLLCAEQIDPRMPFIAEVKKKNEKLLSVISEKVFLYLKKTFLPVVGVLVCVSGEDTFHLIDKAIKKEETLLLFLKKRKKRYSDEIGRLYHERMAAVYSTYFQALKKKNNAQLVWAFADGMLGSLLQRRREEKARRGFLLENSNEMFFYVIVDLKEEIKRRTSKEKSAGNILKTIDAIGRGLEWQGTFYAVLRDIVMGRVRKLITVLCRRLHDKTVEKPLSLETMSGAEWLLCLWRSLELGHRDEYLTGLLRQEIKQIYRAFILYIGKTESNIVYSISNLYFIMEVTVGMEGLSDFERQFSALVLKYAGGKSREEISTVFSDKKLVERIGHFTSFCGADRGDLLSETSTGN
eukprot:GHVN01009725.1.p1 GENE.GHVN01009725.1~~GHVN01009725.1.p1  ORF type:complete len:433 (+),score=55.86 GHVN01009725.1:22-1320(+)